MIIRQFISSITLLFLVVLISCGNNATGPAGDHQTDSHTLNTTAREELSDDDSHQHQHRRSQEVTGELIWYSSSTGSVSFSHRFIYSYIDSTLELNQVSYLNGCCPNDLVVSIDVSHGTIRISEKPAWDGPIFWVLSHLEAHIEIRDLPVREYEVRFDYSDSAEPLTFYIDLVNQPSGQRCFAL